MKLTEAQSMDKVAQSTDKVVVWEPDVHTSIQVTLTGRIKQIHKNGKLIKVYHEAILTEPATWWRKEQHRKEWLPSDEVHRYTTTIL